MQNSRTSDYESRAKFQRILFATQGAYKLLLQPLPELQPSPRLTVTPVHRLQLFHHLLWHAHA